MIIKTISTSGIDKPQALTIGRQMENNCRQFEFDCSGYEDVASLTLVHQRHQDVAPYMVASAQSDTLVWTVTDTDTAYAGYGKAELRITFNNGLMKSAVFSTRVIKSITADMVIPEPLESWYDAMIDYVDENSISQDDLDQAIADYIAEHPISAPVTSVNTKTGDVVLNASDVGALPDSTVIPSKTSQLQNDSGYLTSYTETDPVFSASPAHGITAQDITDWNNKSNFSGNYNDLTNKPTIPSKTSQLQNDSNFVSDASYVHTDNNFSNSEKTKLSGIESGAEVNTVKSVNGQTGAVTVTDTNTTYTISISGNVITLTPSTGTAQSITLPVYNGGVI